MELYYVAEPAAAFTAFTAFTALSWFYYTRLCEFTRAQYPSRPKYSRLKNPKKLGFKKNSSNRII